MSEMAAAILTPPSQIGPLQNYYFPNNMFNRAELCSLFQMLSHNLYDTTQYPRNASLSKLDNLKNQQFTDNMATNSLFLPDQSPIKEEGVVSFRSNKVEAIQMSRVLIVVIAGLSGADAKSQPKDILKAIRPLFDLPNEYDKAVDPVMMVTLADLYGVSAKYNLNEQKKYYFDLSGEWSDQSCTTNYGIGGISPKELNSSRNYVHATRAEIRGGIDGYKIGTALKNLVGRGGVIDVTKLRLSQILRSYYSKPQSQISPSTFSVSYCDRTSQINIQDVENQANIYAAIVSIYKSMVWPPELNQDFKRAFTASQSIGKNMEWPKCVSEKISCSTKIWQILSIKPKPPPFSPHKAVFNLIWKILRVFKRNSVNFLRFLGFCEKTSKYSSDSPFRIIYYTHV